MDAIIINTVTTAATPQMTKLATAAGIPLVYVNRRPFESFEGKLPKGVAFVGSDDDVPGKLQAEALVRILNGKGNIAMLMGELGSGPAEQRTAGAEKVIAQQPDMKVIKKESANWQRVAAMDVMNNWLVSGEKIDGVIANSGEMAIGAVMALQAAGRDPKKTPVAATDGTQDGLTLVGKGDLAVDVFQDAKGQGKLALDLAVKMAKGEQVESINWVPYQLVTKENYKEFSDR
jgi:inositol transport system substrate-binding protein